MRHQRTALKSEIDTLSTSFSKNEAKLAELEQQLNLETGSLGELFGVVRQTAKELKVEQDNAVTGVDHSQDFPVVDQIVVANQLPSMAQLTGLWHAMASQIAASDQIAAFNVPFLNGDGEQSTIPAFRLGSIGLIGEQGYLHWMAQDA